MSERLPVVTLTTDFGLADGYVGIVKGVILSIAPQATLVDLSHEVDPWDIRAAQWILKNACRFFAEGTVHVAVVDPGVGSLSRPLLVSTRMGAFLAPDNGLLSFLWREGDDVEAFQLNAEEFWLAPVSNTFHARDIYAPAAAYLANGIEPHVMGRQMKLADLSELSEPRLVDLKGWLDGEVVYEDRFGNLITNIPGHRARRNGKCLLDGRQIGQIMKTYSSAAEGAVAVIVGSHGAVEISVYQGRASKILEAGVGSSVRVESKP